MYGPDLGEAVEHVVTDPAEGSVRSTHRPQGVAVGDRYRYLALEGEPCVLGGAK